MSIRTKTWPENCIWPEPGNELYYWEAEDADSMPLDDEGEELLDLKDYMDDLVREVRLNDDYTLNEEYDDFISAGEENEDEEEGEYEEETGNKDESVNGKETGNEDESVNGKETSNEEESGHEEESWDEDDNVELDDERDDFIPEKGTDYWFENHFDLEAWEEDMAEHLNLLKLPLPSPVAEIQQTISYEFVNENLLRQAFTRRAFGVEYKVGDSEKLEFLGDSVLNTVVTQEIIRQVTEADIDSPSEPFISTYSEGDMTKIRQHYVCKEYLAQRATALGLDQFILYGTGEEPSESSREDMMEALVGAVAVDSEWDWSVLSNVVDSLLCIQYMKPDSLLKETFYEIFNSWHQRKFGQMPEYEVSNYGYCTLRFYVPENDKGIRTAQRVGVKGETRSRARELAAEKAYGFVVSNGLWMNLKDAGIEPKLENAINQLQELYQKKYIEEKPSYDFEERPRDEWYCSCICGGLYGWGRAKGKTLAKKKASFMVLVRLMKSAGLSTKEMEQAMWKTMEWDS